MTPELDIVIPVYNEGRNIGATLSALARGVKTPARVLICYDHPDDDTLPAIRANPSDALAVEFVRNAGRGAHAAVMTGFAASTAPFVLMYPADDAVLAAKPVMTAAWAPRPALRTNSTASASDGLARIAGNVSSSG